MLLKMHLFKIKLITKNEKNYEYQIVNNKNEDTIS